MSTEPSHGHPPASLHPPHARRRPVASLLRYVFLAQGRQGEVVIYSHSNLFYWWPVWLLGFIMAGITWYEDHQMAVVPAGTVTASDRLVDVDGKGKEEKRTVLILPAGTTLPVSHDRAGNELRWVHMAYSKDLGVIFATVLLVVLAITNIPLRGTWSWLVIAMIILLVLLFAYFGFWQYIVVHGGKLAIHINMGGYLFLSLILLIVWLTTLMVIDRQFYVIVSPGQVRVHLEIGGGEMCYDSTGMVFQKQRSDTFRHWVLGFGSGDLILRPANSREHIDMPNVLAVGRRVRQIERFLREKKIVSA